MDQGASAKERLPPAFAHLPLRVRIVVVRAHVFAAGLGKPFTSLRHGRGRSQKNNVSGAGGARNKRSSLATSGGGGFLGGRKKGVGAAGRQPGRPSADRHAIRNLRAPAAHAHDDPPTSGAHRGNDEVPATACAEALGFPHSLRVWLASPLRMCDASDARIYTGDEQTNCTRARNTAAR